MRLAPFLAAFALVPARSSQDWTSTVREHVEQGRTEEAIAALERHLADEPRDAGARRALARLLQDLARQGASPLVLFDAREQWDRALDLEPFDLEALRNAIAVRLELGETEAAAALGARALGSAWMEQGEFSAELVALACRARIAAFRSRAYRDPDERARELASTWSVVRRACELEHQSPELAKEAAAFLEQEGLPERAAALLTDAIERAPAASELHRALIDLHLRAGVEERLPELYEGWSTSGTNATLAWYAGYAWRLSGDLGQRERRSGDALAAYQRCGEWMGVAATLEPDFRATTDTIHFQCALSSAWCRLETGELARASAELLALLRAEPARRDEPDGLGRSLMQALSALGERRVAANDYEHASAEARSVVEVVADEGLLWNNLGFLLREYATQVASGYFPEIEGHEDRARELYRESWQAYLRACELLPADARVTNDAALVQVYHLRDDLARAETMLARALQLGEEALAALGDEPPESERFPIAQAIGDACLNLGYLHYHVYRQPERSREFFARSLASDSGERPDVEAYLAAIDGLREPLAEPDRGSFVPAPAGSDEGAILLQPRDSGRAALDLEASLAEARDRARAEGRVLLVYNRGQALGLAVPALDALVSGEEFAERARDAILVVCDRTRRTFVDRRHDGRRVACPQWAPLTCTEHQTSAEEFAAWWRELEGSEPGESEEGLFVLRPGEERPRRLTDAGELEHLATSEERVLTLAPFEAVEASLGGEDGGAEARGLVGHRSLAARIAAEQVLWEGFASSPARGHLLRALAEDGHPSSRGLLAVCVSQCVDPVLELAALEVWPAGLDPAALEHALSWSPSEAVRTAALAALRRSRPDDGRLRAREALGQR